MRAAAPPLLAIFRSQLQGEILARVLLADQPIMIADLARELGAPLSTVAREVNRLEEAGIFTITRQGRGRLVTGNDQNPAASPLTELIAVAFGPRTIVADEFGSLAGLSGLFIFGSWAARHQGEAGPVPGDVDVLVVGPVDRDDVYDAADRASARLHRDVNATVVSDARWTAPEDDADPFIRQLRARPLIDLGPANRDVNGSRRGD